MNALNNFDKTDMKYSLAPTWWVDYILEVKGQSHSRPSRWRRGPRRCCGVEVSLQLIIVITADLCESLRRRRRRIFVY